jgi:hypothetical protein
VPAIPAPDDEPHAGRSSAAERHRRTGFGLHPREPWEYLRAKSLSGQIAHVRSGSCKARICRSAWETDHVIEGAADAPDIACGDHLFGGPLGVGAVSAEAHYDCMTMHDLVAIYPRSRCCPS